MNMKTTIRALQDGGHNSFQICVKCLKIWILALRAVEGIPKRAQEVPKGFQETAQDVPGSLFGD